MPKEIPHFTYHLTNHSHPQFRMIMANNKVMGHIWNTPAFYLALGYKVSSGMALMLPEEFIWSEYHKDDAVKSEACLQARIIAYLNMTSILFTARYGSEYPGWAGSCSSKKIRGDASCTRCHMHLRGKD